MRFAIENEIGADGASNENMQSAIRHFTRLAAVATADFQLTCGDAEDGSDGSIGIGSKCANRTKSFVFDFAIVVDFK